MHRLFALAAVALAGCSSPGPSHETSASTGVVSSSTSTGSTSTGSSSSGGCENLQGEGYAMGQVAENWSLPDHIGAMIALYDFCGKVIFYEEGSMW